MNVKADWKTLYDQGGLCLVLLREGEERKWVKTGIEFTHGGPHVSTVGCDRWVGWIYMDFQKPDIFKMGFTLTILNAEPLNYND